MASSRTGSLDGSAMGVVCRWRARSAVYSVGMATSFGLLDFRQFAALSVLEQDVVVQVQRARIRRLA
jgi:hypothetical protein